MRAPLTATHRSIKRELFMRVTNEEYADQFFGDRWIQSNIPNIEILATDRHKYVKLLHTGFERVVANMFQWSIGSVYRVKKIKIY